MTDKLKQKIKEEVEKLPKEKQEAINAIDWVALSEEIGKKFLLSESEANDLQVQILLVLIGLTNLDDFARNVENEVGTTKEDAEKIADEVIQKIFIPITNIGTENIKKNLKDKNPNTTQTLNFILSGGDYSAFVEEKVVTPETPAINKTSVTPPTLADIKANAQSQVVEQSSLQDKKTNIPIKPTKMTDIKGKLVI